MRFRHRGVQFIPVRSTYVLRPSSEETHPCHLILNGGEELEHQLIHLRVQQLEYVVPLVDEDADHGMRPSVAVDEDAQARLYTFRLYTLLHLMIVP
jgi:hypothetical protein